MVTPTSDDKKTVEATRDVPTRIVASGIGSQAPEPTDVQKPRLRREQITYRARMNSSCSRPQDDGHVALPGEQIRGAPCFTHADIEKSGDGTFFDRSKRKQHPLERPCNRSHRRLPVQATKPRGTDFAPLESETKYEQAPAFGHFVSQPSVSALHIHDKHVAIAPLPRLHVDLQLVCGEQAASQGEPGSEFIGNPRHVYLYVHGTALGSVSGTASGKIQCLLERLEVMSGHRKVRSTAVDDYVEENGLVRFEWPDQVVLVFQADKNVFDRAFDT